VAVLVDGEREGKRNHRFPVEKSSNALNRWALDYKVSLRPTERESVHIQYMFPSPTFS